MENLFSLTPLAVAMIPVTLGLVSAIKQVGLPSKFAALTSIGVGVGLMSLTGVPWQADVAQGIIVGLAASGLYSGSKATFSDAG